MRNVYVYCEGPTEEAFINKILSPNFLSRETYLIPILCVTKRTRQGVAIGKGGVSKYSKIQSELKLICGSHKNEIVTTMFDYYGMPSDTPGMERDDFASIYDKVSYIENQIIENVGVSNLIPNLIIHEFEGLLFSNPESFKYCDISSKDLMRIKEIRNQFDSPELINNSPETAPSKRVQAVYPQYGKITDGINIALDMGLDTIRKECNHFDDWLKKIESL